MEKKWREEAEREYPMIDPQDSVTPELREAYIAGRKASSVEVGDKLNGLWDKLYKNTLGKQDNLKLSAALNAHLDDLEKLMNSLNNPE